MSRLLLSIGFLALLFAHPASANTRPNILWIIGEDMGTDWGVYGEPGISTPRLDRLARSSVVYRNAFGVTSICSTSRSAFMTGMWASSIGAHQHRTPVAERQPLPDGVRLLTGWLKDLGYYTANIKWMDGVIVASGKADWNFDYPREDSFDVARWELLKDNQPFYAQVNLSDAHRGWSAPSVVDPEDVRIPPYYPDRLVTREDWAQYLDEIVRFDTAVGKFLDRLEEDGLANDTIVVVMGDNGRAMLRGKEWLYDSGLRVPLMIRWAPDHLSPEEIRPGSWNDELISLIDLTATTIVAMAGGRKPETMQGRVFLGPERDPPNTHLFATRDRSALTTFHIRSIRSLGYRYIRNFMNDRPFLQYSKYKDTHYPVIALMRNLMRKGQLTPTQEVLMAPNRPAEELYDVQQDPYEIHNLATSPLHAAELRRLRGILEEWIVESGDQGPESAEKIAEVDAINRTRAAKARRGRGRY